MAGKMRVSDAAKIFGIDAREVVEILNGELKEFVKTPASTLEQPAYRKLEAYLRSRGHEPRAERAYSQPIQSSPSPIRLPPTQRTQPQARTQPARPPYARPPFRGRPITPIDGATRNPFIPARPPSNPFAPQSIEDEGAMLAEKLLGIPRSKQIPRRDDAPWHRPWQPPARKATPEEVEWASKLFDEEEREAWMKVGLGIHQASLAAQLRAQLLEPADLRTLIDGRSAAQRLREGEPAGRIISKLAKAKKRA